MCEYFPCYDLNFFVSTERTEFSGKRLQLRAQQRLSGVRVRERGGRVEAGCRRLHVPHTGCRRHTARQDTARAGEIQKG